MARVLLTLIRPYDFSMTSSPCTRTWEFKFSIPNWQLLARVRHYCDIFGIAESVLIQSCVIFNYLQSSPCTRTQESCFPTSWLMFYSHWFGLMTFRCFHLRALEHENSSFPSLTGSYWLEYDITVIFLVLLIQSCVIFNYLQSSPCTRTQESCFPTSWLVFYSHWFGLMTFQWLHLRAFSVNNNLLLIVSVPFQLLITYY
jgi:hypothetical protein